MPEEKLVICGSQGAARAYGIDGKVKPTLSIEEKPLRLAAYSFHDSKVLFVREGNLWLGRVNWLESKVEDAKRVTDVGYFRDSAFQGQYDTLLYISAMGATHRND